MKFTVFTVFSVPLTLYFGQSVPEKTDNPEAYLLVSHACGLTLHAKCLLHLNCSMVRALL